MSEDGEDGSLIADLGICGAWSPHSEALFDILVTDTDAQSYLHHAPESVCFRLRLKRSKSILPLLLPVVLTLPSFAFPLMVWPVLRLCALLKDLPLDYPPVGREATLLDSYQIGICYFACHRTVCKRNLLEVEMSRVDLTNIFVYCLKWRCFGLEDGASVCNLTVYCCLVYFIVLCFLSCFCFVYS